MSKIYLEIFDPARLKTFKLLTAFKNDGVLAGGTAIALQLNHRVSFDFDIFIDHEIDDSFIRKITRTFGSGLEKIRQTKDQITFITKGDISVTFVYYPYKHLYPLVEVETDSIKLFDLRDLASNKAYVIGRRGVWRDYIDIFFLLKGHIASLESIIQDAQTRFDGDFSSKLFLEQLSYTKDLEDFKIDFIGNAHSPDTIINYLNAEVKKYLEKELKNHT